MRILLLAIGTMFSFSVAHADYQDLVAQKLERLNALETRVDAMSGLLDEDKKWAMDQLWESKMVLNEMSESSLEDLQAVEQAINETCKEISERILRAKKMKLMSRIEMLDAMIAQYQEQGLDTMELEALSDSMRFQVEALMPE